MQERIGKARHEAREGNVVREAAFTATLEMLEPEAPTGAIVVAANEELVRANMAQSRQIERMQAALEPNERALKNMTRSNSFLTIQVEKQKEEIESLKASVKILQDATPGEAAALSLDRVRDIVKLQASVDRTNAQNVMRRFRDNFHAYENLWEELKKYNLTKMGQIPRFDPVSILHARPLATDDYGEEELEAQPDAGETPAPAAEAPAKEAEQPQADGPPPPPPKESSESGESSSYTPITITPQSNDGGKSPETSSPAEA